MGKTMLHDFALWKICRRYMKTVDSCMVVYWY